MAFDPGLASMRERSSREQMQNYSPCQRYPDHEVFLSHSGKQKPFVHDLFSDFKRVPRFQYNEPFFDVQHASLPKGEEWTDRLIEAAGNCKVAVMILTKDFLTSKWPMLELLHFINAQKTTNSGMKLLPVFYDPYDLLPAHLSDIHIQKQWKRKWEKMIGTRSSAKPGEVALTVESCEEALRTLRCINGIVAEKGKSSAELRKCIVEKVLAYLPPGYDPEVDRDVEGCRRLCDMISQMFQRNDEGIQCLGMYGIGGSGKTTMCTALCKYFGRLYNQRVYHLQIGENDSAKAQENFSDRCKKLLKLMGLLPEVIDRIQEPHKALKKEFGKEPVFLAIDDVREDLSSHLEIQDYMSYLCSGSRIIITARSRDIVEKVTNGADYCKPIPNLEEKEALILFLKIAAPKSNMNTLTPTETEVLLSCLQICYFKLEEEANHNAVHMEAGGGSVVLRKGGQYHPLALRAVASYFRDQYSKLGSDLVRCGQELLKKRTQLFNSNVSQSIFDVLGLGFEKIHKVSKQLFIDVALYAPRPYNNNIFSWLVDVNGSKPDIIRDKLDHLRKMSFLDYEDNISEPYQCTNFSMHELYTEYAKLLVDKYSYKYGIYYDHSYQAPPALSSSNWAKAPRIWLRMWKDVMKVKEWRLVSVIHLFHCETVTTFSIEGELVNLRELKIHDSSKLEEVSWTQDFNTEQLCFVELSLNRSLKILPDFSNCSKLRELVIIECSSSMEPLHLHNCSSLQLLKIVGTINAPEVRSVHSCLNLRSVQLAWRASYKGILDLENLPSLSTLEITGPSDPLYEGIVLHGYKLFCQYYPEETVCYEVTGIRKLTNLKKLHLNYVPLGCLPGGLRTIGSSLEGIDLRGCLLSQLIDFSDFPNLHVLTIAHTNVKELRGLGRLKKLVYLECRYNFRLRKIPNLRPCERLEDVCLAQCPELQAIPRLPPSYSKRSSGSDEETARLGLAIRAFTNTAKSAILRPTLRRLEPSTALGTSTDQVEAKLSHLSLSRGVPNPTPHLGIQCDGCMMKPLIGARYKAKGIETKYNLCRKCYSNKCYRSDCNFKSAGGMDVQRVGCRHSYEGILNIYRLDQGHIPGNRNLRVTNGTVYFSNERCIGTIVMKPDYDLCQACFTKSGYDVRDFYPAIHQTIRSVNSVQQSEI